MNFNFKNILSKKIKIFLLILLVGIIFCTSIRWYIVDSSESYIYSSLSQVSAKKVGIVLGARVFPDGRVSDVLADRLLSARDAYKMWKIQIFLLSGDNSTAHYNEVEAMKQYLVRQWIGSDAIVLDYAGFDTYDTMYRAKEIFGVKDAVIFTQDFHQNRSVYTARSLWLDVVGYISDRQGYIGMNYLRFREFFASLKAFGDTNIWHSDPKFLGKKEISVITLK